MRSRGNAFHLHWETRLDSWPFAVSSGSATSTAYPCPATPCLQFRPSTGSLSLCQPLCCFSGAGFTTHVTSRQSCAVVAAGASGSKPQLWHVAFWPPRLYPKSERTSLTSWVREFPVWASAWASVSAFWAAVWVPAWVTWPKGSVSAHKLATFSAQTATTSLRFAKLPESQQSTLTRPALLVSTLQHLRPTFTIVQRPRLPTLQIATL